MRDALCQTQLEWCVVCACGPCAVSVIYVRRTGGCLSGQGKDRLAAGGEGTSHGKFGADTSAQAGGSGSTTSNESSQGSKEGTTVSGSEGRGSGREQSGGTRPGGGAGGPHPIHDECARDCRIAP